MYSIIILLFHCNYFTNYKLQTRDKCFWSLCSFRNGESTLLFYYNHISCWLTRYFKFSMEFNCLLASIHTEDRFEAAFWSTDCKLCNFEMSSYSYKLYRIYEKVVCRRRCCCYCCCLNIVNLSELRTSADKEFRNFCFIIRNFSLIFQFWVEAAPTTNVKNRSSCMCMKTT